MAASSKFKSSSSDKALSPAPSGRAAKILVVDDRPENLLAFEALLEPLGAAIVCANSGSQALKCLLEDDFSVILLDVQMPIMDGFETASLIKERQRSRDIPIIFVTAIDFDPKYVSEAYRIGAVDYLIKPILTDILRSKVRVFLDIFDKGDAARRQSADDIAQLQLQFEVDQKSRENMLRAQHEDALAATSAQLQQFMAALDCTNDLIALFDPETLECLYCNQGTYKSLGYTRDEMFALKLTDIMPDFRMSLLDQVKEHSALGINTAQRVEAEYRTKSGTSFPVEVTLQIVEQAGMPRRCATIARDITERKIVETRLAEGYARERRIADVLQKSLLLTPPASSFDKLEIGKVYEAAWDEANLGGDFYDLLSLEGGRVALVIGDVTGKGLAAAARTAEVKYALRAYLKETGEPAAALSRLNEAICSNPESESADVESFVCTGIAIIDPSKCEVIISTAGIEPPAIIRRGIETEVVTVTGLPLGIIPNNDYENHIASFNTNDILLLVTDGITEARGPGEMFGFDRMVDCVRKNAGIPVVQDVGDILLCAAKDFAGGKLHDDACVLVARCI